MMKEVSRGGAEAQSESELDLCASVPLRENRPWVMK